MNHRCAITIRTARHAITATALAGATAGLTAACGSTAPAGHQAPMSSRMPMPGMASHSTAAGSRSGSMPGMAMPVTDGRSATHDGYRMTTSTHTMGRSSHRYRFTIKAPPGKPLTSFHRDQTKLMHFYAVRSDLTGYQHVHPRMAKNGAWTAPLAALEPGTWRLYASFVPGSGPDAGQGLVLSRTVTVPGAGHATQAPLLRPTHKVRTAGYTITLDGRLMAGTESPLTMTVTHDGRPVTNLQPYLDTYAHLSAFHQGDLAFAHLHPATPVTTGKGGPRLTFHAELPRKGAWRTFIQFKTNGSLHTAAVTLDVM